jgi:outer membrane protein TolC
MVILPDPARTVTETEAIALALKQSRRLQSLAANVEIAGHRLSSSGPLPNPELRVSNLSTRSYDERFDELRLGLRIRLPDLGERREDREKARTEYWERKVEQERYGQELAARVRHDFADALAEDRLAELAERRVEILDRRIGMIEQMIRIGERSIVYYIKAKSMRAEAHNDLARAVQSQNEARRQLARRTGLSLDAPLAEGPLPEAPGDRDRLIQTALARRPETGLVRQEVEYATAQRNFERLKLLPWLNYVQVSYHREQTRNRDWGEVSAGIELPLFDWNIGNIKATNLAVRKRQARTDGVRETIEEEVGSAYAVYRDLWLDWRNFSAIADTNLRDAEDVVSKSPGFEALRSDEIMELELTSLETRRLLVEKRRDLANALADLLFALGAESLEPEP